MLQFSFAVLSCVEEHTHHRIQNLDADDTRYVTNHNEMLFELNDKFQFMPDLLLLLILKTSTMRVMLVSPRIIPPPQRANPRRQDTAHTQTQRFR